MSLNNQVQEQRARIEGLEEAVEKLAVAIVFLADKLIDDGGDLWEMVALMGLLPDETPEDEEAEEDDERTEEESLQEELEAVPAHWLPVKPQEIEAIAVVPEEVLPQIYPPACKPDFITEDDTTCCNCNKFNTCKLAAVSRCLHETPPKHNNCRFCIMMAGAGPIGKTVDVIAELHEYKPGLSNSPEEVATSTDCDCDTCIEERADQPGLSDSPEEGCLDDPALFADHDCPSDLMYWDEKLGVERCSNCGWCN